MNYRARGLDIAVLFKPGATRGHIQLIAELTDATATDIGAVPDLGWAHRAGGSGRGATLDLLGTDPDHDPEGRWAAADPARLLPTGIPTVLLHGQHDDAVPVGCANSYLAAAQTAGDPCRLHFLPGVGHFEFLDPTSRAWPHVLAATAHVLEP